MTEQGNRLNELLEGGGNKIWLQSGTLNREEGFVCSQAQQPTTNLLKPAIEVSNRNQGQAQHTSVYAH